MHYYYIQISLILTQIWYKDIGVGAGGPAGASPSAIILKVACASPQCPPPHHHNNPVNTKVWPPTPLHNIENLPTEISERSFHNLINIQNFLINNPIYRRAATTGSKMHQDNKRWLWWSQVHHQREAVCQICGWSRRPSGPHRYWRGDESWVWLLCASYLYLLYPHKLCLLGWWRYTVFTLSVRARHFDFFYILKRQWWNFIKLCKHIDSHKINICNRKIRAWGQFY